MQDLDPAAFYIFAADTTEPRGHLQAWQDATLERATQCICIVSQEEEQVSYRDGEGSLTWASLRDDQMLLRLVAGRSVYLDISGLAHHVWVPLLRLALSSAQAVRVVYAEPLNYRRHASPASPALFDLSVAYRGILPLPGMARLAGPLDDTRTLLVTFLGFEGNRARHMALSIDPVPKVVPVIGVPGFQIEYPAFTIASNREFLAEHQAYSDIRWARASCPFSAHETLTSIATDFPQFYMYIAPVGTKPHALGAVQFAIEHPGISELLYDHPVRKAGRTEGVGVTHVYTLR
ncbi:MAG: hypothetical protein ACO1TH_11340 [Luteitalea sp.]